MKPLYHLISSLHRYWPILAILIALPAFWTNLGRVAVIDDEGIRCHVALEMIYTGDYLVPRMFGEYYYKKPPLFNWFLAGAFELTGDPSERTARGVTLLFLALYTWCIFYFFKKEWGPKLALWTAMATLTCGRILFWDSMLALIDISFSLVVFSSIMLLFQYREKGRYRALYLSTYALTAVGFMLKALPAIAFQGLSLIGAWLEKRAWRPFFHPWHFIAGLGCLGVLGIYYFFYGQNGDLNRLFTVMFFESSQRTPVHFGLWDTFRHLFEFPVEMLYHFLPWSLFPLLLLVPGNMKKLRTDRFGRYLAVLFLANIWLYWISPQVYPRYLLMLAPLYFGVGLFLYEGHERSGDRISRGIRVVVGILTGAILILVLSSSILVEEIRQIPYWFLKSGLIAAGLGGLFFVVWRIRDATIPVLILVLLFVRLGFSWFVLPLREDTTYGTVIRDDALRIGEKYRGEDLRLYDSTYLNASTGYYLTRAFGDVVPVDRDGADPDVLYIVDTSFFPDLKIVPVDSMRIRQDRKTMIIGLRPDSAWRLKKGIRKKE